LLEEFFKNALNVQTQDATAQLTKHKTFWTIIWIVWRW